MPDSATFSLYLVAALICILMPGPAVLYVLANGLGRGRAASVAAACGTTAGVSVHVLAAVAGLAALLHASALVFHGVKLVGAGYLIFLAWRTLRARDAFLPDAGLAPKRLGRVLATGFAVNILNPKLSVFFLAFLPQFVAPDAASPSLAMLALGGIFMAMTLAVFLLYGLFATALRAFVAARPAINAWLRWLFAGLFFGLGLRLALAGRD